MSSFNESEIAKTRKAHLCYGCGWSFPVGSRSLTFYGFVDDGPWRLYFCPDCVAYRDKLGRGEFMELYNECIYDESDSMNLREDEKHPKYESHEDYRIRIKKEKLAKQDGN